MTHFALSTIRPYQWLPRHSTLETVGAILLLAIVLVPRLIFPGADIPPIESSQATNTDGYWYVAPAVAWVQHGRWETAEVAEAPLYAAAAAVVFKLGRVSYVALERMNVVFGLVAWFFVVLTAARVDRRLGWLTAFLLALDYQAAMFTRTALVYTMHGMLSSVSAWLALCENSVAKGSAWGVALLNVVGVRRHALIQLPALFVGQARSKPRFLVMAVLVAVLAGLTGYALFPDFFLKIPLFLRHDWKDPLWNVFGTLDADRFFSYAPVTSVLALYATLDVMSRFARASRAERLFCLWYVLTLVAAIPFDYNPVRYFIVAALPRAVLAAQGVLSLWKGVVRVPALLATGAIVLAYYIAMNRHGTPTPSESVILMVATTLFVAARAIPIATIRWGTALVIIASVAHSVWLFAGFLREPQWTFRDRAARFQGLVSDNAHIIGPYADAMFMTKPVRKTKYRFMPRPNRLACHDLLSKNITHIALDDSHLGNIYTFFDRLTPCLTELDAGYVRGFKVRLFRIEQNPVPSL